MSEEVPLSFDPHILRRHPDSFMSEWKFKWHLSRAVKKYGCVQHGDDCPLGQSNLQLRSANERD